MASIIAYSVCFRAATIVAELGFNRQTALMALSVSPTCGQLLLTIYWRATESHKHIPTMNKIFMFSLGAIGILNPFPYARAIMAVAGVLISTSGSILLYQSKVK